ncbi:MAG: ATP-binding protein [Aggregatilineales bacterium]
MVTQTIPKRTTTAILQSLAAGVVPRTGLEHIAVGRKEEIAALLHDLDQVVADGGASFRFILGKYGSGKSFLCQLIRGYALNRNFVVCDADLSPTVRLTGTQGQGLALYRELLKTLSTRTRPDGNAFSAILERWINDMQTSVIQSGISPTTSNFGSLVEQKIHATINQMEGMVHGFDFATVLTAYWNGHLTGDDARTTAALRWLRGEFATKTEAKEALGVRVIIDDNTWYDYLKLLARFVTDIGYKGLVVFIDEAVNLYKISNTVSRNNNYERLLTILNDALQGKAQSIGFIIGATPQMVEDRQRGLFGYDALRTRLEESRYVTAGVRDLSSPMIRLNVLTFEEIFVLLQRIRELHALHYGYSSSVTDAQIKSLIDKALERIGADQLLTPREVIRDFVSILNILHDNPAQTFEMLVGTMAPSQSADDPEALTPETEINDESSSSLFSTFTL